MSRQTQVADLEVIPDFWVVGQIKDIRTSAKLFLFKMINNDVQFYGEIKLKRHTTHDLSLSECKNEKLRIPVTSDNLGSVDRNATINQIIRDSKEVFL